MKTVKINSAAGIKYVPCKKIDATIRGDYACHKNVIFYIATGKIFDIGTTPFYYVTHLPTGRKMMELDNKEQATKMITLLAKKLSFYSFEEAKERKYEIKAILRDCMRAIIK